MQNIRKYLTILAPVWALLIYWLLLTPIQNRFLDLPTAFLTFGRLFGLVGIIMFSLSLMLSSRIGFWKYLGVDVAAVCRAHHDLSEFAFIFMLLHPLTLAASSAFYSLSEAVKIILPPLGNYPNFFGFIAIATLIPSMLGVYFLTKNYKIWLWTHRITLVAFLAANIHILIVPSETTSQPILKYYILGFSLLGFLLFVYQRIVKSMQGQKIPEAC